ncbi:MAG: hypothetical protein K2M43_00980 [Mycoplasmoidaceae bacterium]|nr:hypothetical protein [Mycoplasmoidaceae bacterium]
MYNVNVIDIGHDIENVFVNFILKTLAIDFDDLKTIGCTSNLKFIIK